MARIFALSDLHVDNLDNMYFVERLSFEKYKDDVLIVAGDVTDNVTLLKSTFLILKKKFKEVVFVPGNHDIWIRERDSWETSDGKFHRLLRLCKTLDVKTDPLKVRLRDNTDVWIVPLFSWYSTPEEDAKDSLYIQDPSISSPKDDWSKQMWMDYHHCVWPDDMDETPAKYFSDLNTERCKWNYDAPVISLSHMLPRRELILADADDHRELIKERQRRGLPPVIPNRQGATEHFNFTRFAGSQTIEKQIRQIGSVMHVYGHQHRNRDRIIEGVRYVSHCLGSKHERAKGLIAGMYKWNGPKQIYPKDAINSIEQ